MKCHVNIQLAILLFAAISIPSAAAKDFAAERKRMVDEEIVAAGVKDPRVIQSMRDTLRHEFVNIPSRSNAYFDMALPIGNGQTISPPFVVAYMTEQIAPKPTDKVLEIGTGSGYQAAVLSPLVKDVYTIEIVKPLGERAARTLKKLNYKNVHTRIGDGYQGWSEAAPFDKIIVTCSPEEVPQKLVDQLREGGRMIVPVGERYHQTLYLFQKQDGKLNKVALLPTLFVPMTGQAEAGRTVLPDAAHPHLNNGGFEELTAVTAETTPPSGGSDDDKPEAPPAAPEPSASGWHYQRQMKIASADDAPEGKHYATFNNAEPGRGAQALQGLAVDGRKVKQLDVSLWVKAKNVQQGANQEQQPVVAITFYDDNRAQTGYTWVGPWRDTFPWQKVTEKIRVPAKAREAVVRLGLSGATGEISFDDVRIQAAD